MKYDIKVGSLVISQSHPYDRKMVCEVDRIYIRNNSDNIDVTFCRLVYFYKGEERTCNLPIDNCVLDISEERSRKLTDLFG